MKARFLGVAVMCAIILSANAEPIMSLGKSSSDIFAAFLAAHPSGSVPMPVSQSPVVDIFGLWQLQHSIPPGFTVPPLPPPQDYAHFLPFVLEHLHLIGVPETPLSHQIMR